jgi:hypothetical protein
MHNGGIRRTARRGIAVAVLGWLAALGGSVLVAPSADAAPTATVQIKDLTPPLVSVDAGGSVTFVNRIEDKASGVTLPLLGGVSATVHTDVALAFGADAPQTLAPGQSLSKTFPGTTAGVITYTYRVDPQAGLAAAAANQVVNGVLAGLPPLPLPTPFAVNTLVPLPNLPSLDLPRLPQPNVPGPGPAPVPTPGGPSVLQPPVQGGTPLPAGPAVVPSIGGTDYNYGVAGAAQLAPAGAAGSAFDASRLPVPGRGAVGTNSGSGGGAGSIDGATVPAIGRTAGLGRPFDESRNGVAVASDAASLASPGLSVPALLAVLALAGTSTALLRARRA